MEVTSFNWLGKFELMKLVQTIEVAFNDTPAEIPAIEVNDRCTIHNINVSRHKNITAVDTTFGFFFCLPAPFPQLLRQVHQNEPFGSCRNRIISDT